MFELKKQQLPDSEYFVTEYSAGATVKAIQLLENSLDDKGQYVELCIHATIHCLTDKDGVRIYKDDDDEKVRGLPFQPLNNICEMVLNLSGLSEDEPGN